MGVNAKNLKVLANAGSSWPRRAAVARKRTAVASLSSILKISIYEFTVTRKPQRRIRSITYAQIPNSNPTVPLQHPLNGPKKRLKTGKIKLLLVVREGGGGAGVNFYMHAIGPNG
jgi:hypothetical protein